MIDMNKILWNELMLHPLLQTPLGIHLGYQ